MRTLLVLFCLLVPASAFADDAIEPDLEPSDDYRSPAVALGLSAGITVGGVALLATASAIQPDNDTEVALVTSGLVLAAVGPTVGNIYAGKVWNRGLQLRLAGLPTGLLGVGIMVAANCYLGCPGSRKAMQIGGGVLLLGSLLYAVGTVVEIVHAPYAAKQRNERRSIAIAPSIAPGNAGVVIGGAF